MGKPLILSNTLLSAKYINAGSVEFGAVGTVSQAIRLQTDKTLHFLLHFIKHICILWPQSQSLNFVIVQSCGEACTRYAGKRLSHFSIVLD